MLNGRYSVKGRAGFIDTYPRMYPGKKIPRSVTFIVTEDCNLNCSYCYQRHKSDRVMSWPVAKAAVDTLYKADAENSEYINPQNAPAITLDFIGGEPLLQIDLISRIVDYFLERAIALHHRWQTQFMIAVSTNGTLYFDERVRRFLLRHAGRVSMGITIDGNQQLHDACRRYPDGRGSYSDAAAAFADIIRRYGQTGTKLTIAPDNLPYLAQAVKDMREAFGITCLYGNCVNENVWNDDLARVYYEQLKQIADWMIREKQYESFCFSRFDDRWYVPLSPDYDNNWCGGVGMMLAFGVDGVIYPCQRYAPHCMGSSVKPLTVGHIAHGIEATDDERDTVAALRAVTRRSQSTDECYTCPVAAGCGWCSAYNYEVYGTVNKRTTFICVMHQAEALANVYYWNRLARALQSDERFPMRLDRDTATQIISDAEYDELVKLAAE